MFLKGSRSRGKSHVSQVYLSNIEMMPSMQVICDMIVKISELFTWVSSLYYLIRALGFRAELVLPVRSDQLDPVSYQCQNGFGIGQRIDADVVALERFHEGLRHAVGLRAGNRREAGFQPDLAAKMRVSFAV